MEVQEVNIEDINVSNLNTRKDLGAGTEDSSIEDLANSIKEKGLLNPITVMKCSDGKYDLIAGQRRFLACKKIGLKTIPAIIRESMDDTDATIISLIENVHRADMAPIDKAKAYSKIYEKYNDYGVVAKETGMSILTIKKYLKLLELSPLIQDKLTTSDGPAGIGTLSKLAETFSKEEQEEVLNNIGDFKQDIQLEILKRSKGDLNNIPELREQALAGAFDVHVCKGINSCPFIPEELVPKVKEIIDSHKE